MIGVLIKVMAIAVTLDKTLIGVTKTTITVTITGVTSKNKSKLR